MEILRRKFNLPLLWYAFSFGLFVLPIAGTAQNSTENTKPANDVAVSPPANLKTDGVPPVSVKLQKEVDSIEANYYLNPVFKLAVGADKQPVVTVKELGNPVRLLAYRQSANAVAKPETELEIPASDSIYDLYPSRDGSLYLYNADTNGDGQFRFYLYNPQNKQTAELVTKGRNVEPVWSPDGTKIAFGSAETNQEGMSLIIADVNFGKSNEKNAKRLVAQTKFMLTAQDWSSDGKFLAYIEYFSNRNSAALWLVNTVTNERKLISPAENFDAEKGKIPFGEVTAAQFSPNGKTLYFAANHAGEFVRLYAYNLVTGRTNAVTAVKNWDVEQFRLSPDGESLAVVYDDNGASRLFVAGADVRGEREIKFAPLAAGVIEGFVWSETSDAIAFNFASAQLPASIFYVDTKTKLAARLIAASPEIETERTNLAKAELISWKAADNLNLSGWMYKPASHKIAQTKAKLPVIIDIHGGPEAAARPEFSAYDAYYLNSGGAAVIYPNVRGSTGRGKTFLDADNALKRDDAVRDFGKLLYWIAKQPDLDAEKVMLRGFSYGGYMALLVAATYPQKVAAVSVESAPTNLVTFLETTSGWRRAQRRNEYGDERNLAIRAGLDKIAPRNLTQNLQMPLLIVHGKRDPRVPFTESEKFVAAVREKGNRNVWFLLAETDGHGLTGDNSSYSSLVAAQFFQNFVANRGKEDSSSTKNKRKE